MRSKDARYAAGLCIDCTRAPHEPDRVRCTDCLEAERRRANARYRARTGASPRAMRCGLCKTDGHERRRCPTRVA